MAKSRGYKKTSLTKRKNTEIVSLDGIASEINEIAVQVEQSYHRTAELLHIAREQFEEENEKGFMEWATSHTPYKRRHIDDHLRVYEKFLGTGRLNKEKPIPFTVLRELTRQDVPAATVAKVLRKFDNVVPPSREEVRQIVKEAKPEYQPPALTFQKPFAERCNTSKFHLREEYLLDTGQFFANAETVRILAKHWKNKYHPDKGGDAEIFNRICKAEKTALKTRGEV